MMRHHDLLGASLQKDPVYDRIIVAGSKDFEPDEKARKFLKSKIKKHDPTTICCGDSRTGADIFGAEMANELDIKVRHYAAEWDNLHASPRLIRVKEGTGQKYNALAAFNRNEKMIQNADALILFGAEGDVGSEDLRTKAIQHGVKVIEYDETTGKEKKRK